ncbi:sensor domain-containing diguanylate cyclase [Neptunomonas marina]|uniref:diguanylate cyclase n=2 Tax=Neptunomonas marina TaxID=1815562 RepID=A0A437Q828_9GAMM|nr:sensor domain-containing diguanylate cyclase [Neptunomonas marina]
MLSTNTISLMMPISHVQPRSLCCLPLVNTEPSISVMVLEHRETPNLFSSRRLEVLELFAAQYAISFENIRLYEQLQQQNDQLEHTVAQRTQELERKSHYLLAILDALPMPYALTTLSGECISSNALLNERLEVPPDQLTGQSMVQFYDSPEDRQRFLAQLEQHGSVSNFECRLRTRQQQRFWALVSATYVDLQDERVIFSTISDFSEYKALEKQLYQEANTDALTGILNRRAWLALAAKQQTAHPFRISCILMIDLDHFKALNDNYGHAAGDEVLRQFTTSIQRELREDDLFGRMGGEEFAIVFGGLDLDRAYSAAERLRTMVEGLSVMIDTEELRFTFSAGLCRLRPSEPVTSALKRADKGLYQAKASGRNQVWFEKEDAHRPDI